MCFFCQCYSARTLITALPPQPQDSRYRLCCTCRPHRFIWTNELLGHGQRHTAWSHYPLSRWPTASRSRIRTFSNRSAVRTRQKYLIHFFRQSENYEHAKNLTDRVDLYDWNMNQRRNRDIMIIFNEIERDDNTIRLKLTPTVEKRKRAKFLYLWCLFS